MKRSKRYGGFLVGDRVQRKDGVYGQLQPGVVVAMRLGRLTVEWVDLNGKAFKFCFMPNQLVNLTRQWEVLDESRNQRGMREWLKGSKGQSTILEWLLNDIAGARKHMITFSPSDLPSDTPLELL